MSRNSLLEETTPSAPYLNTASKPIKTALLKMSRALVVK
jgi:hypothetical protein